MTKSVKDYMKKKIKEKESTYEWKPNYTFKDNKNFFNLNEKREWDIFKNRIEQKKSVAKNGEKIGILLIKNENLFIFLDDYKIYRAELICKNIKNVYSGQLIIFFGSIDVERNVLMIESQSLYKQFNRIVDIIDICIQIGEIIPTDYFDLFINIGDQVFDEKNIFNCRQNNFTFLPIVREKVSNPLYIKSESIHIHVLNYDIINEATFLNENFNMKEFLRNFLYEKNYFPFYKYKNYAVDYASFSENFREVDILLINSTHNFLFEKIDGIFIINIRNQTKIEIKNNRLII